MVNTSRDPFLDQVRADPTNVEPSEASAWVKARNMRQAGIRELIPEVEEPIQEHLRNALQILDGVLPLIGTGTRNAVDARQGVRAAMVRVVKALKQE